MTEQEQTLFYELLEKFIIECDMQYMNIGQKAQELKYLIDEL